MKTKIIMACLLLCSTLSAQNPIVPPGVFLADPEGHQWKDGRLYFEYGVMFKRVHLDDFEEAA